MAEIHKSITFHCKFGVGEHVPSQTMTGTWTREGWNVTALTIEHKVTILKIVVTSNIEYIDAAEWETEAPAHKAWATTKKVIDKENKKKIAKKTEGNRVPEQGEPPTTTQESLLVIIHMKAHIKRARYKKIFAIKQHPKLHRIEKVPISFNQADWNGVLYLHDNTLVFILLIANYTTRRILIDNESSTNAILGRV